VAGFLHLAAVPEAFSRRIVGSAMSRSEAVKTAFQDWSFEYARVMV
jgi:hypothetical protein